MDRNELELKISTIRDELNALAKENIDCLCDEKIQQVSGALDQLICNYYLGNS